MSDTAHARHSDPETSHEAAASVSDVKLNQAAVYELLICYGPMTDEMLVTLYEHECEHEWSSGDHHLPRQSPSGIRTRRSELVKQGRVIWTGRKAPVKTGRQARLWDINLRPRTLPRSTDR